jgi:lysozyme family protein
MSAPTLAALQPEYARLWQAMTIHPSILAELAAVAHKLIAAKPRYQSVEKATTVPWPIIAVIHERECGADFRCVLHNGERILGTGRKTTLVPKGRGPFATWEAAAEDALALDHLTAVRDWSIAHACYMLELYNGFGYRAHGVHSPYLWSGSNNYTRGKFVADGRFDAGAEDKQLGCMPIVREMMTLDPTVMFPGAPVIATKAPEAAPSLWQAAWKQIAAYIREPQ